MIPIDLLPSIVAYCNERIAQILKQSSLTDKESRIAELRSVIVLAEGLQKQTALFAKAGLLG